MNILRHIVLLYITLSVALVSFSQNNINQTDSRGQKQGLWQKKHDNDKMSYTGNFVNNKPVGEWLRYHENGNPLAVMQYDVKGDTCRAKLFSDAGQQVSEGKYLNKNKEGKWLYYSVAGKIFSTEMYSNGLKNGIAQVYDDKGNVVEKKTWVNGKKEGVSSRINPDGTLIYEMLYRNGRISGLMRYYFPNGQIQIEGRYVDGIKYGTWKSFDKSGRLLKETVYTKGVPDDYDEQLEEQSEQLIMLEQQKGKIPEPQF